jgi:hypothetical protein
MPNVLSEWEIEIIRDTGLFRPKRLLTKDEAAANIAELETYEAETGGPANGKWRYKSHLVFP